MNTLMALRNNFFQHTDHDHTGREVCAFALQGLLLEKPIPDLGTNLLEIEFLTTVRFLETYQELRTGEKKTFLLCEPF